MLVKIGRKTFSVYAYDVESHNDSESLAKNETSIWLSSFINEESKLTDDNIFYYTIEDFLKRLEEMTELHFHNRKRNVNNILIEDYNLSFEYSFILPILLFKRFKFKPYIDKGDSYCFNSVTNKSCASVWQVQLKFSQKGGIVIFRDLAKMFPGGLANVAKSFGLPTQKGEIDYTINRLHGWKVTPEEKLYSFTDTKILMDILEIMYKRDDKDFWKSCSVATYSCRKLIKVGFPHAYKPLKAYRKYYPELGQKESDFLRNSVAGGITYAPTAWQFKEINQRIRHYDLHQAHPSQCAFRLFPQGEGEYFTGKPRPSARICCCHVLVSYSGVRLHSVIKLIGTEIATKIELTLWDFEIELMKKAYYDLQVEYIDGYAYKQRFLPWRSYYIDNYAKRMEAKKNHDAFNTMYYKLLNNSSYGKFEEKGHTTYFENYVQDNGVIDSYEKPRDNASINATFTYLPLGSAIAAYTRTRLVGDALKISPTGQEIVYFDTDSIFFLDTPETRINAAKLDIGDGIGQWGIEKDIRRGQFAAPKRYKIEEINEDGTTCDTFHLAGVNFLKAKELPCYDGLNIIHGHYFIQGIKRVKGGTIIITKEKELGIQPKYVDIYKNNVHNKAMGKEI